MHDQHSESSVEKTVGIERSFEKTNFINLLVCDIPHKWDVAADQQSLFRFALFANREATKARRLRSVKYRFPV
jgi:hypothetical protein